MPRNYRLQYWDYKGRGIYMITMNIDGRQPLLGVLQGGTDSAWVEYSSLGKDVSEQIEQAFEPYAQIQICAKQLMPDHLHFVVWVKEAIPVTIGEIIRKMKIGCTHAYQDYLRMNAQSTDAISKQHMNARSTDDVGSINDLRIHAQQPSLFEPGFHDRVLLHAGQLRSMINYVHDNPRRAAIKRAHPELFKLRHEQQVAGLGCTILGNFFLPDDPMKEVLQCSRSLTQTDIDRLKNECLQHAARGVVYVSAGISEGEKQICKALREAGFPLIILLSKGFPASGSPHARYYKPQGVYFETCAAGKLLLIEPSDELYEAPTVEAEVYQKTGIRDLPHTSLRYRFLALNAMVRRICR